LFGSYARGVEQGVHRVRDRKVVLKRTVFSKNAIVLKQYQIIPEKLNTQKTIWLV